MLTKAKYIYRDETYNALHATVQANTGDVAALSVITDYLREYCEHEDCEQAKYLLEANTKALKNHYQAFETHKQIDAVILDSVPVMSENRCIGTKEQAKLTRQLFKKLGIQGASITSDGRTVRVILPERYDEIHTNGMEHSAAYWLREEDEATQANANAKKKIKIILAIAFPNHDDRSDIMTDYFDYCWSFN